MPMVFVGPDVSDCNSFFATSISSLISCSSVLVSSMKSTRVTADSF